MDSNPRSPARETTLRDCLLIEEVRFALDSPLEGDGFEPSVPRKKDPLFKSAQQRQRAVHNELCDRRNDQVLDAAKFSRETARKRIRILGPPSWKG